MIYTLPDNISLLACLTNKVLIYQLMGWGYVHWK